MAQNTAVKITSAALALHIVQMLTVSFDTDYLALLQAYTRRRQSYAKLLFFGLLFALVVLKILAVCSTQFVPPDKC